MENPNEYDDEAFTKATNAFQMSTGLSDIWEAGGSLEDIEEEVSNYLEAMTDQTIRVSITRI